MLITLIEIDTKILVILIILNIILIRLLVLLFFKDIFIMYVN